MKSSVKPSYLSDTNSPVRPSFIPFIYLTECHRLQLTQKENGKKGRKEQ